ncbi:insulinase family protein [Enterovibrio sp. ZSDZ35]|uniref:Insulinase family protein n=1 Tax=Enterovibrio qingdaonensis TaxID=2899818 RepID=A0ABT5QGL8_9GAMM|nr:M16 family metallopeptidase [Enterovibrio sp. ZSDZ35]MDD1779789.1 insulinase family protein [Enterovibrio sp. ZSDZ35]
MLVRLISPIFLLFVIGCSSLPTSTPLAVDSNWVSKTLPNGFQYHLYPIEGTEIEIRLIVNVGSLNEEERERGYAHFVEHMAFNGSRHFPDNSVFRDFATVGVQFGPDINAVTDYTRTVYTLSLPDEQKLEDAITWFRDIGDGLTLSKSQVEGEVDVIFGEWRFDNRADASWQLKLYDALLKNSRYAERDPIGTESTLVSVNDSSLRAFYERWYQANRMQLVVVGGFDANAVASEIDSQFETLRTEDDEPERHHPLVLDEGFHYPLTVFAPKGQSSAMILSFNEGEYSPPKTLKQQRDMWADWFVLDAIEQRLSEQLDRRGIAYNGLYSGYAFVPGWSVFEVITEFNAADRALVLDAVADDLASLRDEGISDSEFSSLLEYFESSGYLLDDYLPIEVAESASDELYYNELPQDGEQRLNNFERFLGEVDHEGINARLRNYLSDLPQSLSLVYVKNESIAGADTFKTAYFSRLAKPGEDIRVNYTDVDIPQPTVFPAQKPAITSLDNDVYTWEMPNNVRALFHHMDDLSLMSHVVLQAKGGLASLSRTERAAVDILYEVLRGSDVGPIGGLDFRHYLEGNGIEIEPAVYGKSHNISMSVQSEYLPEALNVLRYFIENITLSEAVFDREKARVVSRMQSLATSPYDAFEREQLAMIYPAHSYDSPLTVEDYEKVTFDHAERAYSTLFRDVGAFKVYVISDYLADAATDQVNVYLGAIPVTRPPTNPRSVMINEQGGELIRHTSPEDRTYVEFADISRVPSRDISAVFAEDMMNRILQDRYTQIMREEYAFDYDPYFASWSRDGEGLRTTTLTALISPEREAELNKLWPEIRQALVKPITKTERDNAARQLERDIMNLNGDSQHLVGAIARYETWGYGTEGLFYPATVIRGIDRQTLSEMASGLFSSTIRYKSVMRPASSLSEN